MNILLLSHDTLPYHVSLPVTCKKTISFVVAVVLFTHLFIF